MIESIMGQPWSELSLGMKVFYAVVVFPWVFAIIGFIGLMGVGAALGVVLNIVLWILCIFTGTPPPWV